MITTGSTRGKCSAPQLAQRRDQPPRTITVEWPQLAQKACRECQRPKLIAAANSGASPSSSSVINGNGEKALAATGSIAEKRGDWPSRPRKSSGRVTFAQTRCPSSDNEGRPSRHSSWSASGDVVNA